MHGETVDKLLKNFDPEDEYPYPSKFAIDVARLLEASQETPPECFDLDSLGGIAVIYYTGKTTAVIVEISNRGSIYIRRDWGRKPTTERYKIELDKDLKELVDTVKRLVDEGEEYERRASCYVSYRPKD